MNTSATKALLRFVHPGNTYLILAIALIFFGFVSIQTIFLPILCIGCTALLIWLWSSSRKQFKADLAAAEQTGDLDTIAADFSQSKPVMNNKIRVGMYAVYGKKCGRIIRYKDIRRFYIHTNKSYYYPTCELQNGQRVSLCQLRGSGSLEFHTNLITLANNIRSHNPSIAVDIL